MLHALLRITIVWPLLVSSSVFASDPLPVSEDVRAKQRALYLDAKQAYRVGQLTNYRRLKKQLVDYPLYPYLEYRELNKELATFLANLHTSKRHNSTQKKALIQRLDQFFEQHEGSHLDTQLRRKWLGHLAATKSWRDYKHYYRPHVRKTTLQCFYLQSKMHTESAFPREEAQGLWLSGKSQPKACDPVFARWQKNGHMTQDLLWERHKLAAAKKSYSLAAYLQKKMDPTHRYLAELYLKVHKDPASVTQVKTKSALSNNANASSTKKLNDIIYNGVYRYASRKPLESLNLLAKLSRTYRLEADEMARLHQRLASQLVRKKHFSEAEKMILAVPQEKREQPLERLLRHFIAEQQWGKIYQWVQQLPEEQALSDRWQYWQARASEELEKQGRIANPSPRPNEIYTALASSRSFYGFLSADKIDTQYQFEDRPAPVDMKVIEQVRNLPAIARAKEFFLLNELYLARTEWRFAVRDFSMSQYIAAGQLAHLWGWNRKAIEAMAGATYWDDLTIRFPIVHDNIIHHKAKKNNVSSSLLFSIARQESAWEFDAKSRVGARGLMQIMPATARETAKKAKIRYSKKKLFEPEYNITLGSHYISGLLKQYDNNRALAIASYNAGPHRVKRWLSKTEASLPIDAWIEIIPFKETRRYVQNVLSYEVIYNYRQGRESNLLTFAEANTAL